MLPRCFPRLTRINSFICLSVVGRAAIHQGDSAVAGREMDRGTAGSVAAAFQIHELGYEVVN